MASRVSSDVTVYAHHCCLQMPITFQSIRGQANQPANQLTVAVMFAVENSPVPKSEAATYAADYQAFPGSFWSQQCKQTLAFQVGCRPRSCALDAEASHSINIMSHDVLACAWLIYSCYCQFRPQPHLCWCLCDSLVFVSDLPCSIVTQLRRCPGIWYSQGVRRSTGLCLADCLQSLYPIVRNRYKSKNCLANLVQAVKAAVAVEGVQVSLASRASGHLTD
jgi:hypothetical protein